MAIPKRYNPKEVELRLISAWQSAGVYHFSPRGNTGDRPGPVYSIDTPPATVSGHLHLGHVYSYSHADFMARFWRMNGYRVFYPMGYDDNGLPTERLVEKRLGITAAQIGRSAFIEKCLETSEMFEEDYETLWKRLGLSIDWRYTYRTIDQRSRLTSQLSFIDLYRKDLTYRQEAPAIWCPECHVSIAQADLNDLDRQSEFVYLPFFLENGESLAIATTRPELLPACVAVFVHPEDTRYQHLVGRNLRVPYFGQWVPLLLDPTADPTKGTGVVMCCTFGDAMDVAWWHKHKLPLIEAIDHNGQMTQVAGELVGMPALDARQRIKDLLDTQGLILDRQPTIQSVRVHERCDTAVEYILVKQWFIRVLDFKEQLLQAGRNIRWHPEYMRGRYEAWVENLSWDWCISRQRYFGVPFPVWYCQACGETILADEAQLPVDPTNQIPSKPCACGSTTFTPETDILDTWATSSMTPQIVGQWLDHRENAENALYTQVFPFTLRTQAHEIIRTWAFYTIVKSIHHFQELPWKEVLISGWGLAGEDMGKISKSRGGGPMPPLEMIEQYSADAVRYWAASTATGKDAIISEEKIQMGMKLVTKLWNVARFSEPFFSEEGFFTAVYEQGFSRILQGDPTQLILTPADRWILASSQSLIRRVTDFFHAYDYTGAKNETEGFFWNEFTDNYLEMCKLRLYDRSSASHQAGQFTLATVLLTLLKLFAPILPYITDEIYQSLYGNKMSNLPSSVHRCAWPKPEPRLEDNRAERLGIILIDIATQVRRYKSDHNLPLGSPISLLQLTTPDPWLASVLPGACEDLTSICRATTITFTTIEAAQLSANDMVSLTTDHPVRVGIKL